MAPARAFSTPRTQRAARARRGGGALALLLLAGAAPLVATTYQVGPTRTYTTLGAVAPLLVPGDLVEVDGGVTYPAVAFTAAGTAAQPITIRGLRVGGQRPILAGGTNTLQLELSDHMVIEGLEVTGGSFRCVYHHAADITLRDLYVHDCPAHGILGADEDSGSLTLEYSEVARCGNGASQHAIYMSTDQWAHPGAVFRMQHNYVHDQNGGNAVKSRAERNEIRYNWLEGTLYHLLELIGPDEGAVTPPAGVREDSDVVGNVLVHKAYTSASGTPVNGLFYFVRVGGDIRFDDGGANASRGRYRFVHNTFVRTAAGADSTVFRPFGIVESITMTNNVFYRPVAGAMRIFRNDLGGEVGWTSGVQVAGQNNWVESGTTDPAPGWTGTLSGADPGFEDAATLDLRPAPGSALLDAGTATPADPPGFAFPGALFPPAIEPPLHTVASGGPPAPRAADGALDLGAYERAGLLVDGFETGSRAAWSRSGP